jgi:hypothetical protein
MAAIDMKSRDTSAHEVRHTTGPVTGSLKQGDDTSSNPAHGEAMQNTRHFNRGGHSENYSPSGMDVEREDPQPPIEHKKKSEY